MSRGGTKKRQIRAYGWRTAHYVRPRDTVTSLPYPFRRSFRSISTPAVPFLILSLTFLIRESPLAAPSAGNLGESVTKLNVVCLC